MINVNEPVMNYIKKLENQVEDYKQQLHATQETCNEFLKYLRGEKFLGFENNFVNAQEVRNMIEQIRYQLEDYNF